MSEHPGSLDALNGLLATMRPITLDEMAAVKLMNRVDQKYLLNHAQLQQLLSRVCDKYYVQRIEGDALAPYNTLYFDTEDLGMYTAHHNRKLCRQKLRVRCYRSTKTTFFEIKNKNNKGKTKKKRITIDPELFYTCLQDPTVCDYLVQHSPYPVQSLRNQVENFFRRITLVDLGMTERITIDSEIRFHNHTTGQDCDLSPLVVMEVKHAVGAPLSDIEKEMLNLRIHPKRMSKYCVGTTLTNPNAKHNRFKPKIRYIYDTIATSL